MINIEHQIENKIKAMASTDPNFDIAIEKDKDGKVLKVVTNKDDDFTRIKNKQK